MSLIITPAGGSVATLDDIGDVTLTTIAANELLVRNAGNTAWVNLATLGSAQGGTGINNGGRTLTINTNSGTIAFAGAGTTMTFPSTTDTLAGLAQANVFSNAAGISISGTADTATAASHYFVETATDGVIRPKTLANAQAEIVTTATVNTALNSTSTAINIGGTTGTNVLTMGRSTGAQTLNLGTGATLNATTKIVNIGTAGVSGSTTQINIGSAVSGSTSTITIGLATAIAGDFTLQDSVFIIQDDADNTKRAAFECSTIATGTTRTFTFPNASGTLALTSDITATALTTEKAIALSWGGFI